MRRLSYLLILILLNGCVPAEELQDTLGDNNLNQSDEQDDSDETAIALEAEAQVLSIQDNAVILKIESSIEAQIQVSDDSNSAIIAALNDEASFSKNKIITLSLDQATENFDLQFTDKKGKVLNKKITVNKAASRTDLDAWEGTDCQFDSHNVEEIVLLAGGDDDFTGIENGGDFAPDTNFTTNFGTFVGQSQKFFDEVGIDKWVAATFDVSEYKGKILCGSVQFHLKNAGSLWTTDSVSLFSYDPLDNFARSDCASKPEGLTCWYDKITNHVSSWSYGTEMLFNYDMKAMKNSSNETINMIEAMNETGIVHAYVSDDVTVDYYLIKLLVKKSDDELEECERGLKLGLYKWKNRPNKCRFVLQNDLE
ncbi:MAG: hypothetical protein H6621_02205 [Halobacteriovoraceae bacterium]|nr:hypothetical protein [Halobacteriovoraceae bacterium]MCB9093856.1 hypothetical protein [Halobacteriovoraceae bacterium]